MRQDKSGQPAKELMKLKAGCGINNVWVQYSEFMYIRDCTQEYNESRKVPRPS